MGGGAGLDSPHVDIISGVRGVVNYAKMQGNRSFNCEFDNNGHISVLYRVILSTNDGGTTTGGGSYKLGTIVTITAIPNTGYRFTSWGDGNTNASRQITVDGDINLSCEFEEILISFYLENHNHKTYKGICKYGMTFEEFINSSYNTEPTLYLSNSIVVFDGWEGDYVKRVYGYTVITNGAEYIFNEPGD